jgi:2-polyprenyl-3-methyl-5-hydroxy-6-metoxy-1,4-benzoquinol methylase
MKCNTTDITLDYYEKYAYSFANSTRDVKFSTMQSRFTSLLAPGAHILDLGCGSGRDTKAFLDAGFDVTATDGSPELCRYAQELTGIPVRNELFQDLADVNAYDGVWACSSILHLPKEQLADVLRRISRALHPHGIVYTSFKHGDFEGMRNGRYFTDFTEPALRGFLSDAVPELAIEQLWTTSDVRPGREDEQWLNVILRKR